MAITYDKKSVEMADKYEALRYPFELDEIEFRAGSTTKDKTRALALPYLTKTAVETRLDEVIGAGRWRNEFKVGPDGGVLCGISIYIEDLEEWVTKWDGAENTQFEPIKGGLSDAFKRAAVKWGIGRYLYRTPNFWVDCKVYGKNVKLDDAQCRSLFAKAMGMLEYTPQVVSNEPDAIDPAPQIDSGIDGVDEAGPNIETFEDLLREVNRHTGESQDVIKAALKTAGYSSFKKSKAPEMLNAAVEVINGQPLF